MSHMWLKSYRCLWQNIVYSLFYRAYGALLQKRPIISRSLLIVATPYQYIVLHLWMSRLRIICLFCKRILQKRLYFAKETCNCKEPTNRSYPIEIHRVTLMDDWSHTCDWALSQIQGGKDS